MTLKKWLLGPMLMVSVLLYGMAMAASPTPSGISAEYPTVVSNQNIWKFYTDYNVMIEEIDRSLTKSTAGMLSHDATRWLSYIQHFRNYATYWQSQAFLDMPVSHGRKWAIVDPLNPPCEFKDNTSACELMALAAGARDELVLSASAEIPMSLYAADLTRQEALWSAMEGYITFMMDNSPLDQPITSAEENLGLEPGYENDTP